MNINKYQISFHDPDGCIFEVDGRLIRGVLPEAGRRIHKFFSSQIALDLIKEKFIPNTWALTFSEVPACLIESLDKDLVWFEHKKIQFISYAHEWVPEMLLAAAELTLSLVQRLNAEGWDLKDASASNIVFNGTEPVFVDICSIIEQQQDKPYWRPRGQFERHFILPLIVYIRINLPSNHIHYSNSDGLDPLSASYLLGMKAWTCLLGIKHCVIPMLFSRAKNIGGLRNFAGSDKKINILAQQWQVKSIKKSLDVIKQKLRPLSTVWHSYTLDRDHYSKQSLFEKKEIVLGWITKLSPFTVLDLGANTGEFSILASKLATRVIAFEKDIDSARLIYINAKSKGLNIQVVLQDIGYPSPGIGWKNIEKKSLIQRITAEADCVLVLALLHHCLATSGIPLGEMLSMLSQWTRRNIIIEYIPPDDPKFKLLCLQRELDFRWLTKSEFELRIKEFFKIKDIFCLVDSGRTLYLLEKI
jgi:SAM-dependent methyltransferase